MSTIPKARSKETAMISPVNHKKMPSKNSPADYIINIESLVITDPIDSTRISKMSTNGLSVSSAVKAGLVFLGTVGAYYLAKTTGIFSYFGLGEKNSNPKDVGNSGIMKVKNRENALTVRTNLETTRQADSPSVNRIEQTYKDKDSNLKFKEIKVEEFKDLSKAEENMGIRGSSSRRSISVQNPISDQNVIVGNLFDLTIDDTSVFSSSEALFLETTNIPTWLTSSNPNPTFKGSYDTPGFAHGVALSGNYAYVADYTSGLQVIDISDPSNPTFKGSYDTPGSAHGVTLSGNYAYVAARVDMVQGNLQIIDISDPANPTAKGSYDMPYRAWKVALSGNYAYVADGYSGGLQIIDISNPWNPTFKGVYDTPDSAYGVALSGNHAYVADGNSGLQIIDITDPSNPTFKGSYDTPSNAYAVTLSGNYAYVADELSGLQIIDISDPSNPTFKGFYDTPDNAREVALFGNYAYVADSGYNYTSGLQIIDISDPANPTFSCSYNTSGKAYGVALSGNYAYVADGNSGLQIIALNIVTDSLDTDLTITLIIIGSITGAVCIASFCCVLIGSGIVELRRYRNKILGNESNTKVKKLREEKELQKLETSDDKKIVVDNKPVVKQEKPEFIEYDEKPLKNLCCPISSKLMKHPVIVVESGKTYDKESIEDWFKNHDTDPLTKEKLKSKQFIPNLTIEKVVEEWITKHKIKK
jgi:hypothetical protein